MCYTYSDNQRAMLADIGLAGASERQCTSGKVPKFFKFFFPLPSEPSQDE